MKRLVLGIVVFLAILLLYSMMTYNGLVSVKEDVHSKWAQVKKNYQRRADLIPDLVNTVKGYVDNESKLLTGIANSRNGYENAKSLYDFAIVDANLIVFLEIIVDRYPNLKGNEKIKRFQDELAGTENRVATARKDYIDSVKKYNKKIERLPTTIFANIFRFEKIDSYYGTPCAEKVPEVNF